MRANIVADGILSHAARQPVLAKVIKSRSPVSVRAIFIPRLCEIENLLKVCVRGDERERRNSASWNEANGGWSSLYISCKSNLFCGVCVSKFAFRITFLPQRRRAGGIKRCCRYINMYRISVNDVSEGVSDVCCALSSLSLSS